MPIDIVSISREERDRVLAIEEGHFSDVKAIGIAPGKLTKTISALSNADGGEVYVGIAEDKDNQSREWKGFETPEAANGHIQVFEQLFPLGDGYNYVFMRADDSAGLVLKIDVLKGRTIRKASDGTIYVRRGAQNLPATTADQISRLERNKGLTSFEAELVNTDPTIITNSAVMLGFSSI